MPEQSCHWIVWYRLGVNGGMALCFSICLQSGVHLVCHDESCAAEYAWYVLGAYLALILADAGWAAASLRLRPPQAAAHLDQKQVQRPLSTALSSLRHDQRLPH